MSEPLYLALVLLGLYAAARYLAHRRPAWLYLSAASLGLAAVTRYIGVSLLPAAVIALLVVPGVRWKKRLQDMVIFSLLGLLPIGLWIGRNFLLTRGLTDRALEEHLVTLKQAVRGLNTILAWFFPPEWINGWEVRLTEILIGALAILAIPYIQWVRRPASNETDYLRRAIRVLLTLQILFHILFLAISKSYFDPLTPFNDRLLAPILPSIWILALTYLAEIWHTRKWLLAAVSLALPLTLIGMSILRAAPLVNDLHNQGMGFARRIWHNSETMEAVRALPDAPIFSNVPGAISMYTGRPAYPIYNLNQIRASVQKDQASLVLFKSVSVELYDVSRADLVQGLSLQAIYRDGEIYHK
jgi:4-amino-4-deoxy-L-arabinose transferase-like glycosyltransferase